MLLASAFVFVASLPALAFTGDKAPVFTLKALNGRIITVNPQRDHRDKLVVFWASW